MVDKNDNLLREVEEELRRERLEKIWREYGTYIIAVALLIVLGVGGYKILENRRLAAAQAVGAQYEAAMTLASEGKKDEAAKAFEALAADAPRGYETLARLQLAGALLAQGKKAEARDTYDALANDANADAMLRGYAGLQSAALRLGEADWTEMQTRLNPLTGDDSPWRYSARELLALAAFKAGKTGEARTILEPLLADQKTPQNVVERAQIVMAEIVAADLAKGANNNTQVSPAPSASSASDGSPGGGAPAGTKKE